MEGHSLKGKMVISLDFELLWGVFDHENETTFGERIKNTRKVIYSILDLFKKYDIHATWGTVGLLFAQNIDEAENFSPELKPQYHKDELSAYKHLSEVTAEQDYLHFAPDLICDILKIENQEIGSHTFSHYYCKERGQTLETFNNDLMCAKKIAKDKFNLDLESIILPRNQFLPAYINVAKNNGFKAVRGNPKHYAYNNSTIFARGIRLLDSYVNICGYKCYDLNDLVENDFIDIKASCFFRQYNKKLELLEKLKLCCIKRQMKFAAKNNKVFHFWWHPHNIGLNIEKNLKQLEEIFMYYVNLREKYGFESKNMKEMVKEIQDENSDVM